MAKKKNIEESENLDAIKENIEEKGTVEHADEVQKTQEFTIEMKLEALYGLQLVDSKVDEIRIVRGELPIEVQDLEDEIEGLETRVNNSKADILKSKENISEQKLKIEESNALIKKYESQNKLIRNNREYDSINKEIEYQTLEIQLSEKKIRENTMTIDRLQANIDVAEKNLAQLREDLNIKKSELESIIQETVNEEELLLKMSERHSSEIEERLLTAYTRIRQNVRNGLAVVPIERDACAGCFNKIPPQRQLDIKMHKKIIVCEFCGRILVDDEIENKVKENIAKELGQ